MRVYVQRCAALSDIFGISSAYVKKALYKMMKNETVSMFMRINRYSME